MSVVTDFTARRHKSLDNLGEGFWVDTQNVNVTVEDSTIARNRWNGLFFEASNGPFLDRNNLICGNGLSDVVLASAAKITFENNRILSNAPANAEVPAQSLAILFGETRRKEPGRPWAVKAEYPLREITLQGNQIQAVGSGRFLTGNYWYFGDPSKPDYAEVKADYEVFMQTLKLGGNTWFASEARPFGLTSSKGYGEQWDFAGWQALTRQDADSRFQDPDLTCDVASSPPPSATPTPPSQPQPGGSISVFVPLVQR